jgi:sugar lactone lactonase YvrE
VQTSAVGVLGDIDEDGNPSVSDAISILRMVVGFDAPDMRGDADKDGAVTVNDAILVLRCVVGLESWPIGSNSAVIDAEGGWLYSDDSRAQLSLYDDAVTGPMEFTVTPVVGYPDHPHMVPGTAHDFGPDGTTFGGVAYVRLQYDRDALPTCCNEADLRMYRLDGGTWQVAPGPQAINDWGRLVSTRVTSLSVYCLVCEPMPAVGYQYQAQFGGPGTADGQFVSPFGIAIDRDGDIYVTDWGNARVQKFDADGNFIRKWGTPADLPGPRGIAVVQDLVYVVESSRDRIRRYDTDGAFVDEWGSSGTGDAQFNRPRDIDGSIVSDMIISDTDNHRVQSLGPTGGFEELWGQLGNGDGDFDTPDGVAYGNLGRPYIVDRGNNRVKKYSGGPHLILIFGGPGTGDGEFDAPIGISGGADGTVFVCDTGNNRIQRFTLQGTYLTQFGEAGSGDGQLNQPTDCVVADNGDVYVVDSVNHRVQIFRPVAL